jgi:hypothetical protein
MLSLPRSLPSLPLLLLVAAVAVGGLSPAADATTTTTTTVAVALQIGILNSSAADLRLKEAAVGLMAALSLSDCNVEVVFSSLQRIESGCDERRVWCVGVCALCALSVLSLCSLCSLSLCSLSLSLCSLSLSLSLSLCSLSLCARCAVCAVSPCARLTSCSRLTSACSHLVPPRLALSCAALTSS